MSGFGCIILAICAAPIELLLLLLLLSLCFRLQFSNEAARAWSL